jgi:hypothetical protein
MATYKVLQDIEAEDKLVGPLTLRQCIYAAIAAVAGYISYLFVASGAAFMVMFMLPFIGIGVFFAFPWRKEQSTEVWALAKVRFALKPRKRIWDQSGLKQLVTVTAPRLANVRPVRHLSEIEVKSRLRALADTIDSRGWAVKNVPLDMYLSPVQPQPGTDRLMDGTSLPQQVPALDASPSTDMFDASSPVGQQLDAKMTATNSAHRQELMTQIQNPAAPAQPAPTQNWYMPPNQTPANSTPQPAAHHGAAPGVPVAAEPTAEELALMQQLKARQDQLHVQIPQISTHPVPEAETAPTNNTSTGMSDDVQALLNAAAQTTTPQATPVATPNPVPAQPASTVTPTPNPAILELANNNDLDVATIARQAQQRASDDKDGVVVSLH